LCWHFLIIDIILCNTVYNTNTIYLDLVGTEADMLLETEHNMAINESTTNCLLMVQ